MQATQSTAEQLETRFKQEENVKSMIISVPMGCHGNALQYIHLYIFYAVSQITCITRILFILQD